MLERKSFTSISVWETTQPYTYTYLAGAKYNQQLNLTNYIEYSSRCNAWDLEPPPSTILISSTCVTILILIKFSFIYVFFKRFWNYWSWLIKLRVIKSKSFRKQCFKSQHQEILCQQHKLCSKCIKLQNSRGTFF